jgi:putative endopeptidase
MKVSYKQRFAGILSGLFIIVSCSTSAKKEGKTVDQTSKQQERSSFDPTYLDKTIRPQDDFFSFANGEWVKNNPIPPSESRWGSFNELEKSNVKKLTEILETAKNGSHEDGSVQHMLGSYYASFMDMDARNKAGLKAIQEELNAVSRINSNSEIISTLGILHKYDISGGFSFGVGQDLKNVNGHISYFSQGGIGLPNKEYYTKAEKKEILSKYQEYVANLFVLAGNTADLATAKAKQVVLFESKLAEKMMAPAELRIPEKSYNKFAKKDLEARFTYLNLDTYFSKVGSQSMDTIVVGQPEFVENLNTMINKEALENWKSYLEFKVLNHYSKHLSSDFVKANFSFYQGVLSGKSEMKPMNERAINELTNMSIGESLGKLFVEKYYSEKSQKRVNEMVDNLLATFEERIKNLAWMSPETKKEALIKLKSIGRKLGFPSKWEDFSDLKLTKDNYIANVKACAARDVKKSFSKLYKNVDRSEWGMPAHMVNAYYHPLLNEIAFPAGIMQAPFFDENAEDAVNYGRIGMVIGHEFVHGFDDMGSKFAADGSFTNWWSEEDRKRFEERTALLGATFASFCPIDGHCVNPDLTMGENIADLGGITLAYYAYSKTEEFKSGKLIHGYTPAQRFFLSFAQLWKINYTQEELKNRIANDPHSPGMYRVNGPLMNCPEFFEAFGIKEGDKMRNSSSTIARIW